MPFTYDPSTYPFLIKGRRWKVGADFKVVEVRSKDRSLRRPPLTPGDKAWALRKILEREDEIAMHSLQLAAWVLGLRHHYHAIDPMRAMADVRDLLECAANDEERESLTRIFEGRSEDKDWPAWMRRDRRRAGGHRGR